MFRLQYRYSRIDKPEPKKLQNKKGSLSNGVEG